MAGPLPLPPLPLNGPAIKKNNFFAASLNKQFFFISTNTGQSLPIPRHSQTFTKNAGLVTLET